MMYQQTLTVEVPAGNSSGAWVKVDSLENKCLFLYDSHNGAVAVEVGVDIAGTVTLSGTAGVLPASTVGFVPIDCPCTHVRATVSGWSSGTAAAVLRASG
jgi:hypothetical protein